MAEPTPPELAPTSRPAELTAPEQPMAPSPPEPQWPLRPSSALALPAAAPAPPALPRRRRGRARLVLAALLSLVLAGVLGVVAVQKWTTGQRPQGAVRSYFQALERGDAPTALAYAATPPAGKYLTSTVLRQQLQVAPMSLLAIGQTSISGSTATVAVHYRLAFSSEAVEVEDTARLVRHGRDWRLTRVASPISLPTALPGFDRLTFAGRPLPTDAVQLFPGALPLKPADQALTVLGQPSVRLADVDAQAALRVAVTDAAKQSLQHALDTAFLRCLRGVDPNPLCPNFNLGRTVPASLRGTIPKPAKADVTLATSGAGQLELVEETPVQATWKTWDFNNQVITKSGLVDISLHAFASAADVTKIYWADQ